MSRGEELEMVTVRLHAGDRAFLQQHYPVIGYNKAIRTLVRKHIRQLQEMESRNELTEDFTADIAANISLPGVLE